MTKTLKRALGACEPNAPKVPDAKTPRRGVSDSPAASCAAKEEAGSSVEPVYVLFVASCDGGKGELCSFSAVDDEALLTSWRHHGRAFITALGIELKGENNQRRIEAASALSAMLTSRCLAGRWGIGASPTPTLPSRTSRLSEMFALWNQG